MASTFTYPIDIETDEAGFVLVTFPDVPEAGSDGVSVDEALAGASDSLIAALGGYIQDRRPIPNPSPARGRNTVAPRRSSPRSSPSTSRWWTTS